MSLLRMIYLVLAIWGALHPAILLVRWFSENGISLNGLMTVWHANPAVSALTWDLTIAAIAMTVWAIAETRVRRNWSALWSIPATWLVGLSFGLPLYLFLRTRPVG